jgi:hypothetical protein
MKERLCLKEKKINIYLIGITICEQVEILAKNSNYSNINLTYKSSLSLLLHMAAVQYFFFIGSFFSYFICRKIPYLSKNVILCKILFMSFHVKTTLFHRFNKFFIVREEQRIFMPRYTMCVFMCMLQHVYE